MSKIQLPNDKVEAYKKCEDQERRWRWQEKEAWDELVELNRKFFRNATARINRRLRPVCGWDARVVDARLCKSGTPPAFGYIKIEVYLGHPGKRAYFDCYIADLEDISQICIEANAVYKAFNSVKKLNNT